LSTPVALFKPIDANTLARLYSEDKIALETQVGHGLKSDGSLVLSVRAVVKKKIRNKIVRSYGELFHYNVTDLVAASGSINVVQGTSPWVSSASGLFPTVILRTSPFNAIGSNSITAPAGQVILILSAVISTTSAAGNRALQVGANIISSKTAAPSSTNVDLLDRPVAIADGVSLSINNGVAGDSWTVTSLRLL
jgi:hypothetical protein